MKNTIICDFETALIPAIRGYFPNTRVQGCYFHFCQAVHRKVGRAYKLKRAGRQKYWRCSKDKEGCGGAIWTNLDVTSVIMRNDPIESCQVDEHLTYIQNGKEGGFEEAKRHL
ncbi:hypothetical protein T09_6919 [Trichinella sp. T9]|nr:hypothetical protein T09_6919 [Trichinella sp. T9]